MSAKKCGSCGTDNCSARELHEEVAKRMPIVARAAKIRRTVLERNGIKLPASMGMDPKDKEFVDSVVEALINLEARAGIAVPENQVKKKPVRRKLRAA